MKRRVIQIVAGCTPGDAITNEVEILRRLFLKRPWTHHFAGSLVCAENIAPDITFSVMEAETFEPRRDDVIIYHYSISLNIHEKLLKWQNLKYLIYHNITPAKYFRNYNLLIAGRLKRARTELERCRGHFQGYFADSKYNANELLSNGFFPVKVFPVLFKRFHKDSDLTDNSKRDFIKTKNILFVGRFVPNKGHADLIKIFYFIQKIMPESRLILAGSFFPGMELYIQELQQLIKYFDLEDCVKLTGYLERDELKQYYQSADLFLCVSHHEGFCVPLLEAMEYNIPILSYLPKNCSAIEETLGGAGLKLRDLNYPLFAETARTIITDKQLRNSIIKEQRSRLAEYQPEKYIKVMYKKISNDIKIN